MPRLNTKFNIVEEAQVTLMHNSPSFSALAASSALSIKFLALLVICECHHASTYYHSMLWIRISCQTYLLWHFKLLHSHGVFDGHLRHRVEKNHCVDG